MRRYILDEVADAFPGNDPLLSENLLTPLRAAQRYDYEVAADGPNHFRVRNPKKGTTYAVRLSADFVDECDCDVFQTGAGTCIHIEHTRIKQNLPSTAQVLAESKQFAYAWLDRAALPVRIRIGWLGNIESRVRSIVRAFLPMTWLDYHFALNTHPRKSFAADRIDAARQAMTGEAIQSWEELQPVIDYFRQEFAAAE